MSELDDAIAKAFASTGKQEDVNKVYLTLLRTTFLLPVSQEKDPTDEEPFRPLFTKVDDKYFMLVFDSLDRLKFWADEAIDRMDYVEILGKDLVAGINENVYLCVNYGTPFYKEFSPDEVKRLKTIVSKIDQFSKK